MIKKGKTMNNKNCIIFDTDMDTDCDDVGAYAMVLEAHLQNKAELIGVIADSVCAYAAPCCEMIAKYYGVDVPIGTLHPDDYSSTPAVISRFLAYRNHSQNCLSAKRSYNFVFAEEIKKSHKDYPSAVSVYRKLLSESEDHSVTVLCVGMLTAITELLASEPDEISHLSGVALFDKKVTRVITMGNSVEVNDFNWGMDAYATNQFFTLCPSPIYVSSDGAGVLTGDHLSFALPSVHPLKRAYEIWLRKPNCGRASWDLIAELYAIDPHTPYLRIEDFGDGFYSVEKKQFFRKNTGKENKKRIVINCDVSEMAEYLNKAMLGLQ